MMCVFGVLPMVPLVGNICTISTNGITILHKFLYQIKLVQMLPTIGTIENPQTHAM